MATSLPQTVNKLVARKDKTADRPARFSFSVPGDAADKVAFHLAKAGMENFKVSDTGEEATFTFTTEPELQVAEEIVQEEFADQIAHRKGAWGMWAPEQADPSEVTEIEMGGKPMVSSDKTAAKPVDFTPKRCHLHGRFDCDDPDCRPRKTADDYDPDRELEEEGRQDKELHEEIAQRGGLDEAVSEALAALDKLYSIESSTDIMELARMSAADLRQFVEDYKAGRARKFSFATGKKCQACANVLPDVKDRVVKTASETIEATLCEGCSLNLTKEL